MVYFVLLNSVLIVSLTFFVAISSCFKVSKSFYSIITQIKVVSALTVHPKLIIPFSSFLILSSLTFCSFPNCCEYSIKDPLKNIFLFPHMKIFRKNFTGEIFFRILIGQLHAVKFRSCYVQILCCISQLL